MGKNKTNKVMPTQCLFVSLYYGGSAGLTVPQEVVVGRYHLTLPHRCGLTFPFHLQKYCPIVCARQKEICTPQMLFR